MTVRILYDDFDALLERHGGVAAVEHVTEAGEYELDALMPSGRWRTPTRGELTSLAAQDDTPDSALIELVRPAPAVLEVMRQLADHPLPAYAPLGTAELGGPEHDVRWIAADTQPGGLTTTTTRAMDGDERRIGVHLDNWERHPRAVRVKASRRRLGVNLGPGLRYVLVAFPDAVTMSRDLCCDYERHIPQTEDVREWARRHPGALTVHRLRLEPGEAYMAPTELAPHDGQTGDAESTVAWVAGRWPRRYFG